jgi:hypothetical protein
VTNNAIEQHQELVAALRNLFRGQPIIVQIHPIHPILIGVTGTIYKDFYNTFSLSLEHEKNWIRNQG